MVNVHVEEYKNIIDDLRKEIEYLRSNNPNPLPDDISINDLNDD